jgi:phage-related protein
MKRVTWIGSSKRDLVTCAPEVLAVAGRELERVQCGGDPTDWKPMPSLGRGAREIRVHVDGELRVFYVATFPEAVYVLHVREKDQGDFAPRYCAGPATIRVMVQERRTMRKRKLVEVDTTGSVFFDLFEQGKAERLSIQSGLALALEQEIKGRKLTQAAAARALGYRATPRQ